MRPDVPALGELLVHQRFVYRSDLRTDRFTLTIAAMTHAALIAARSASIRMLASRHRAANPHAAPPKRKPM